MPNGLSDGALVIDTGLNNSGFFSDARQWKSAVKNLLNSVNSMWQRMDKSGGAFGSAMQQQARAARALNKEIETTQAKWAAVVREMNEIQKTGGSQSRYNELSEEAKGLSARLAQLRGAREALGGVEQGFQGVAGGADKAGQTIAKMAGNGALSFLKRLAAGAKNAAIQLAKLAGRAIQSGLKKIGQLAGGAAKKLFGLGRGARSSGAGLQMSLKNMLRYGLGIRSLFTLFNRLRSAIKEGFDTLANYDPRVRAALASLSGALSGLKGGLAGAFAPILTAVAPALTTLINLLTQAVNAVGMFMAAITGQGYYMAAKGISAVGSAAGSAGGSVKDLKRQLAGFDELNILSANSSGGSGGGGGSSADYSFQQMPIAGAIADFANQMKALINAEDWDGLGHMLADKVNGAFDKARRLISWDNLGDRITKVVGGITGTINGLVDGINWKNIGATFAEGLNTIVNTALLWYRGVDWGGLGRGLANGLNGLITRFDWKHFGDLIQAKFNALFDFTKNFLITFDEIEAARKIREALGRIEFKKIATDFWDTARLAFNKAGNFLKVLLGGDVYDVAGDAVAQMWERGSGDASSKTYAESWAHRLAQTVGEALGNIPWPSILAEAKKLFLDAFDGLLDGLFNSENGEVVLKIVGAIAGVKFGPKILAALLGGGSGAGVAAGANNLLPSVTKVLDGGLSNISSALFVSQELFNHRIKQEDLDEIEKAAKEIKATLKQSEASGGKLAETVSDFVKNGGDERGWARLFNGKQFTTGITLPSAYGLAKKGYYDGGFFPNTIPLDPHYWDDNTDALESNTKAVNGQTKLVKNPASPAATHAPTNQTAGLLIKAEMDLKRDWQGALNGIGDTTISASVNFLPAGTTSFINKPLEYLKKVFSPGTDTTARVGLVRQGFATVASWVGGFMGGNVDKAIGLVRSGWTWLSTWVNGYQGGAVDKAIGLVRSGWTLLSNWVNGYRGGDASEGVGVFRSGWSWLSNWAERYSGGDAEEGVGIFQSGWRWLSSWAEHYSGGNAEVGVSLYRSGWSSPASWVKSFGDTLSMKVTLAVDKVSKVSAAIAKAVGLAASGGIFTSGGRLLRFAEGGMLSGGGRANWWHSATKYASGTSRAHGTMFVAGEAGPEIVGHVNGRTEILNKSQLAQTMQSAVMSGMVAALRGITFTMPAMATGGIMPYEVSAQIARSAADIQGTLNANNEDLIQTIISVAGQLAAALNRANAPQTTGAGGLTAQQVIDEINRRTLMYGASPLRGV